MLYTQRRTPMSASPLTPCTPPCKYDIVEIGQNQRCICTERRSWRARRQQQPERERSPRNPCLSCPCLSPPCLPGATHPPSSCIVCLESLFHHHILGFIITNWCHHHTLGFIMQAETSHHARATGCQDCHDYSASLQVLFHHHHHHHHHHHEENHNHTRTKPGCSPEIGAPAVPTRDARLQASRICQYRTRACKY